MKRLIFCMLAFVSVSAFADVEIIVTASRIKENSKTTPAYVRVITDKEIGGKTTVLDVLKTIPDISVRETSPGKQSISMGGFGENGFGRTLILVNGRPVNRPDMASFDWSSLTLASISRIEIVKGPMSSQYGDQAVAGVINIITKQPKGVSATASASVVNTLSNYQSAFVSYGDKTAGIALGVNRTDDKPARDRSDSTVLSANIDSFYNFAGIKTKIGFNYSNSTYQLPGGLTQIQFNEDPDQAINRNDEGQSDNYSVNGSFDFSLGTVAVSVPLSYSVQDFSSDMASYSSFTDTNIKTAETAIKASSSFFASDSVEIIPVGGIDFNQNILSINQYSSVERTTETADNKVKRADYAVWARTKINCLDTFIFDGGVRYNYSSMDTSPEVTHTELVYDAGVLYNLSPAVRMSMRYGKVFRYPFLDEQVSYYFGPATVNTSLTPETGNSYTFSLDYSDRNVSITVSPYLINMKDEIMFNPSTYKNENIGKTNHYGVSVQSGYSKGILNISMGYSYDHATFTDTDKFIPEVSEHTVTGAVKVTPVKSVTFSTDIRYSSSFYIDNDNAEGTVSGRFEWNMQTDWNVNKDVTIYVAAKNLLDNRTPTQTYWNSWTNKKSMYPMPGRTFETGVKWVY